MSDERVGGEGVEAVLDRLHPLVLLDRLGEHKRLLTIQLTLTHVVFSLNPFSLVNFSFWNYGILLNFFNFYFSFNIIFYVIIFLSFFHRHDI